MVSWRNWPGPCATGRLQQERICSDAIATHPTWDRFDRTNEQAGCRSFRPAVPSRLQGARAHTTPARLLPLRLDRGEGWGEVPKTAADRVLQLLRARSPRNPERPAGEIRHRR